jgi:hypothetical protein
MEQNIEIENMSSNPFGKSLPSIIYTDIERLLNNCIPESKYLEYKQDMPNKIGLQKEILGFANSAGGYLVVGIKAKKPENVPQEIVGVTKEDNIKEKVVARIRDNSTPPFIPFVHLVDLPSDPNRCVLIIHSRESSEAHKASDGYYYYRTENQTIPIKPEFIAKIMGKEKVKQKVGDAISAVYMKIRPENAGIDVKGHHWLGIISCPIPPESVNLSVFSDADWYNKAGMAAFATGCSFDMKSTSDTFKVFRGSAAHPTAFIEYFEKGVVLCCYKLYCSDVDEDEVSNMLTNFLKLLKDTYNKNNFDGGLLLVIVLGDIQGLKWTTGNRLKDMMLDIEPSAVGSLELREETSVAALESDIGGLAQSITTKLKRHFNIY